MLLAWKTVLDIIANLAEFAQRIFVDTQPEVLEACINIIQPYSGFPARDKFDAARSIRPGLVVVGENDLFIGIGCGPNKDLFCE